MAGSDRQESTTAETQVARVPTVCGEVLVTDLGFTLMHEHLIMIHPEIEANIPSAWDEKHAVGRARAALAELAAVGVRTIIDLTVYGLGRNEGIGDSGVRAGILKCASDVRGLTPDVERALRAAARAHRRTGVPVSTHTSALDRGGLDQQRIFAEEGVDLSRVIIGHSGDSTDLGYLTSLLDNGSYRGLDRFGMDNRLSTEQRCAVVAELVHRGHAPRLTLSHDASSFADSWEDGAKRRTLPDWHFGFISQTVIPRLLELGVSEAEVQQMMVANPARIFSAQGPY